jgi:multimeric flavodoxin WrbA
MLVMHALAISGSPRKEGNTQMLVRRCLKRLEERGISGEYVTLAGKTIRTCIACNTCARTKDRTCSNKTDDFHPIFEAMQRADIIIVGSPVYFGSAAPELVSLLDRAGYVSRANGHLFSRKVGGPVAVARRAGHNFTYAQLMFWFTINDMMVAGSTYWNVALAREPGQVAQDAEALATVDRFADNLAWMGERLCEEALLCNDGDSVRREASAPVRSH